MRLSAKLAGLQDGENLTAIAQQPNIPKLAATQKAFALWCPGGDKVVTWGAPLRGGDCSTVQDQLRNVQQICGSYDAFAATLADGNVVTWGNPNHGGDRSREQNELRSVQQICGTKFAFAAFGRWTYRDMGPPKVGW